MKFSLTRIVRDRNFIMNPVRGGRPPRERIVTIISAGALGDMYVATFRCPNVKIFRCSTNKNIVVFISRYKKSIIRAMLME